MISHWWKIIHKSRSCPMTNLSEAPFCMTMISKWTKMPEHIKKEIRLTGYTEEDGWIFKQNVVPQFL